MALLLLKQRIEIFGIGLSAILNLMLQLSLRSYLVLVCFSEDAVPKTYFLILSLPVLSVQWLNNKDPNELSRGLDHQNQSKICDLTSKNMLKFSNE